MKKAPIPTSQKRKEDINVNEPINGLIHEVVYLVRMTISGLSSRKTFGLLGLGAADWILAGKTKQVS